MGYTGRDRRRWPRATHDPESTKISLGQRLRGRQRERWPSLATVQVRFRGRFAYVNANSTTARTCRCAGSAMPARPAGGALRSTSPAEAV
jgi:hypothetical protein